MHGIIRTRVVPIADIVRCRVSATRYTFVGEVIFNKDKLGEYFSICNAYRKEITSPRLIASKITRKYFCDHHVKKYPLL